MGIFLTLTLVGGAARCRGNKYVKRIRKAFIPRPYKKAQKYKDGFLCSNEIIISTKEARKLLGKANSDKISDLELANIIGLINAPYR